MDNKEKASKGLVVLMIVLIVLLVVIWGIVFGIYQYNKHSTIGENVEVGVEVGVEVSNEQDLPRYHRVELEEYHLANWDRYVVKVLVEEKATKKDLINISEKIVDEVMGEKRRFHALAIHYYSDRLFFNHIANLGVYTYAPDGDWSKAEEAKSDFSNFIGDPSQLAEKDWENEPTDEDMQMYKTYDEYEYVDDGIESVANKYNITSEEARSHINKVNKWIYE